MKPRLSDTLDRVSLKIYSVFIKYQFNTSDSEIQNNWNRLDRNGCLPHHHLAKSKSDSQEIFEAFKLLSEVFKLDLTTQNKFGESVIDVLKTQERFDIIELLSSDEFVEDTR